MKLHSYGRRKTICWHVFWSKLWGNYKDMGQVCTVRTNRSWFALFAHVSFQGAVLKYMNSFFALYYVAFFKESKTYRAFQVMSFAESF